MIGISFYLQDPHAEQQILHAAASGVKRAFTSLHIPEEEGNLKQRAKELLELAEKHDIEIQADVSPSTLKHLDIHKFEELSAFGVRGIRLDDGFDEAAIKSLSSVFSSLLMRAQSQSLSFQLCLKTAWNLKKSSHGTISIREEKPV